MLNSLDPLRGTTAAALALAYLGLCTWSWRRARAGRPAGVVAGGAASPQWTVVYASQTGLAQSLAQQSEALLGEGGASTCCLALNALSAERLAAGGRFLFVVATSGDGSAPDNGADFVRRVMSRRRLDLGAVDFGLLALGDRHYSRFCGFGRQLHHWLTERGGRASFAPLEVDRGDPQAIAAWQRQLGRLAGAADVLNWATPTYAPWRLVSRVHLNPGSAGGKVFRLELTPVAGELPDWQAGDLARICRPDDPAQARDYTIASLPAEGRLQLLVRRRASPDGQPGWLSGWLTEQLVVGQTVSLQVRAHWPFRQADNGPKPMILIGNGVGIAGLRAHLKARIAAGTTANWLLFGERHQRCDYHCRDELHDWLAARQIERLDTAFSRDGSPWRYVQHLLLAQADALRAWVGRGAAIYVCGSLNGMAEEVDRALKSILGTETVAQLTTEGRYRRDVY